MARAIWSGAISFGLVNVAVEVMTAREDHPLSFHMLDKADNAAIGYKKINKSTGREVPSKRIVKGYEYKPGEFVIVTDEDFKRANPKATQTIDIEDFVPLDEVDILMFEKPYYLVPEKSGRKGYVLLREVLENTGKVAIARMVMHQKQHLVAVIPRGPYLILETLRYAHEVKEIEEAEYLDDSDIKNIKISPKEIKMAESLVSSMSSKWHPEKYKDTYQSDLKKFIMQKIKTGKVEEAAPEQQEVTETDTNVVDLMPILQKSLKAAGHPASRAVSHATHKPKAKSKTKSHSHSARA